MVRADLSWQPPAEGEYRIVASAGGASTALSFCVVTCDKPPTAAVEADSPPTITPPTIAPPIITLPPNQPSSTPTASPMPSITPSPTSTATNMPTATLTPTTISYIEPGANFWAAPDAITQGECTTLNWDVSGDFQAVYFEGNLVNATGSDSECPASSYTYHLQVVDMYGGTYDYWASVDVAAPPADTSGPNINWTNLVWEACEFYGEADISDESGVAWAQVYYNKNGEGWNSIWMSELSAEYWQADLGVPVDGGEIVIGSIEYYIIASDSLGNQSTSATSYYSYSSCDG